MIMARAAVRRSISPMAPDGTTVSVPTESRSASSMTASAGGDEIGKQGQLAEHEDSRAQHRKGGKGTGTFTEPQTKIKDRLQTQLLEGESLCRLG